MQDAQKYRDIQGRIAETNHSAELLPMAMAQSKLALLVQAITNAQEQLTTSEASAQVLQQVLDDFEQQILGLEVAITNDTVGRRIEDLQRDIRLHEQDKYARKKQAEKYDRLANSLGLPTYDNEETFHGVRQQAHVLQERVTQRLGNLQQNEIPTSSRPMGSKRNGGNMKKS